MSRRCKFVHSCYRPNGRGWFSFGLFTSALVFYGRSRVRLVDSRLSGSQGIMNLFGAALLQVSGDGELEGDVRSAIVSWVYGIYHGRPISKTRSYQI